MIPEEWSVSSHLTTTSFTFVIYSDKKAQSGFQFLRNFRDHRLCLQWTQCTLQCILTGCVPLQLSAALRRLTVWPSHPLYVFTPSYLDYPHMFYSIESNILNRTRPRIQCCGQHCFPSPYHSSSTEHWGWGRSKLADRCASLSH